jgi:hypothetical protein
VRPAIVDITGGDGLYRRLFRSHFRTNGKLTRGAYMINGYPDREPSVYLARLTTVEQCMSDRPGCGVGELRAQVPVDLGFQVLHAPVEGNFAHAVLRGENTREKCAILAEATIVRQLPTA